MADFLEGSSTPDSSMKTGNSAAALRAADTDIHAWVEILENSEPPLPGPLNGLAYGAKDIFETRGITTEYGSPLFSGRKGIRDAELIIRLREAGAVLAGKTQTTAFASFDPAPTTNPRYPGHTPGGSSSGSAAAVAAGMVPFAIGTQTLGSVIRPASFCGICGFKPTFGLIPFDGALPFAPSLDTVGFFTPTAGDMRWLWSRGFGGEFEAELFRAARLRFPADPPMQQAMDDAIARLRAQGVKVDDVTPSSTWPALISSTLIVNAYEGARTHQALYDEYGDRLGTKLCELIRKGLSIPDSAYEDSRAIIEQARTEISALFWDYPAIFSAAALGPPPSGLVSTGDPSPNAPWTALGLPTITIPLPGQLPLGLQIAGAWARDDALVSVAAHAEELITKGDSL
jgi:Asp-tRNA(Asn)/Glu-tRNA(Gln) amidotransferase A subunit family amidase